METKIPRGGCGFVLFSNVIYASYSYLVRFFYICGLFKMVLDCLWVVVAFFEVVVDGCRSFLLLVTTLNEVNNCSKVTLDGR